MPAPMIHLAYLSVSAVREDSHNLLYSLAMILDQCLHNNPALGITGILAFRNSKFLQVLEGPEDKVDDLLAKLAADPRHSGLKIIARDHCSQRAFPGWAMGYLGYDYDLGPMFEDIQLMRGMRPPEEIIRPLAQLLN